MSHGWASVRTSSTLGRYSSAIRAACANERPCGSARGAVSNDCPYRDLIDGALTAIAVLATIVLACAAALQQVDQDLVNEGLLDKVGGK